MGIIVVSIDWSVGGEKCLYTLASNVVSNIWGSTRPIMVLMVWTMFVLKQDGFNSYVGVYRQLT